MPFLDRPLHVINTVHAHHLQASCALYLPYAKPIYVVNIDSIHGVRTKARKKIEGDGIDHDFAADERFRFFR